MATSGDPVEDVREGRALRPTQKKVATWGRRPGRLTPDELLADFVDDVSDWYVRRCRRRFWDGDQDALATPVRVPGRADPAAGPVHRRGGVAAGHPTRPVPRTSTHKQPGLRLRQTGPG